MFIYITFIVSGWIWSSAYIIIIIINNLYSENLYLIFLLVAGTMRERKQSKTPWKPWFMKQVDKNDYFCGHWLQFEDKAVDHCCKISFEVQSVK